MPGGGGNNKGRGAEVVTLIDACSPCQKLMQKVTFPRSCRIVQGTRQGGASRKSHTGERQPGHYPCNCSHLSLHIAVNSRGSKFSMAPGSRRLARRHESCIQVMRMCRVT